MRYLRDQLHWNFRIRVKSSTWIHRPGKGWKQLKQYRLSAGVVLKIARSQLDQNQAARCAQSCDWTRSYSRGNSGWSPQMNPQRCKRFVSMPVAFKLKRNYSMRNPTAFTLVRSEVRSVIALSRLCFVLAVATLLLTVQGQQVVASGKRRLVDCHWQRGNSYLRIGWNWFKGMFHQGWHLFFTLALQGQLDPEESFCLEKAGTKPIAA